MSTEEKCTVWENASGKDITLEIEGVDGQIRYTIRAGQAKSVPVDFDRVVQWITCGHPACVYMPRECMDEEHAEHWIVIGGLAPKLLYRGITVMPKAQTLLAG